MGDRRAELKKTLAPESRVASSLRKGKVVGKGIFKTRINWGVAVLVFGVILFLVWLVLKSKGAS